MIEEARRKKRAWYMTSIGAKWCMPPYAAANCALCTTLLVAVDGATFEHTVWPVGRSAEHCATMSIQVFAVKTDSMKFGVFGEPSTGVEVFVDERSLQRFPQRNDKRPPGIYRIAQLHG